jgi:hypothetical protein
MALLDLVGIVPVRSGGEGMSQPVKQFFGLVTAVERARATARGGDRVAAR